MTYILRKDQVERLRHEGRGIVAQIEECLASTANMAVTRGKREERGALPLERISIDRRFSAGSRELRMRLDEYFRNLPEMPKDSMRAEKERLDREIESMLSLAVRRKKHELLKAAAAGGINAE